MSGKIFTNEHGVPFIEVGDELVFLGCLKPDPLFAALPEFTEQYVALAQSQWQENSLKSLKLPVTNQKSHGACTGFSTCNAFTAAKLKSAPMDKFPLLSGSYIYGQINGGRDQGARVGDAMVAIRDGGTCTDAEAPADLIYTNQFPASASQTAKRFKALDVYKLGSFEELCSALMLGIPCVSGLAVGRNFVHGDLDSNGIAPLPDTIVGGHALCHMGLKNINGVWVVETFNSWGATWGQAGYCYLKKEAWNPGYGFPFDSFAIASVIDDPEDKNDTPPLVSINADEFEDDKDETVYPDIQSTRVKKQKSKKE